MVATPTDYIFIPGTCLKKDFYGVLKTALTNAGWTNVTSNYNTDADVFTSTGNSGDKALVINLKPTQDSIGTTDHRYDIDTTVYCWASIRFPGSYTPGPAGKSGTFERPDTWRTLPIVSYSSWGSGYPMDTTFNYKMYVDKSKIIFSIEYPGALNVLPMLAYIGLPETLYTPESGNRGVVLGLTASSGGVLLVANNPEDMGTSDASYSIPTVCTLASKNPSNSGNYAVSEVYYGSTAEGVRGKLDGILALPNINIRTGTLIKLGKKTYYTLVCHSYNNSSFPSQALAIRIS